MPGLTTYLSANAPCKSYWEKGWGTHPSIRRDHGPDSNTQPSAIMHMTWLNQNRTECLFPARASQNTVYRWHVLRGYTGYRFLRLHNSFLQLLSTLFSSCCTRSYSFAVKFPHVLIHGWNPSASQASHKLSMTLQTTDNKDRRECATLNSIQQSNARM